VNSRSSEACCKLRHPVTFLKFTKRHALTYCRKFRRTSFAGSSSCRRSLPRQRPPVQLAPPAAAAGRCWRRLSAAAGQPAEAAAADLAAAPPAKVTAYCGCKVTHTHTPHNNSNGNRVAGTACKNPAYYAVQVLCVCRASASPSVRLSKHGPTAANSLLPGQQEISINCSTAGE